MLNALCFRLEIAFTGKTIGIMAKSSKTLQDALSAVLQKHSLRPQDASVNDVSLCIRELQYHTTNVVFKQPLLCLASWHTFL